MPNSRQKILNFILEQQSTTVEELSKVFKVTPANIRHHLSILIEQGSVQVIGQKAAAIRGRPAQIYSATQHSNQNNLDHLTETLLSILLQDSGSDERNQVLKKIARQMVTYFKLDTYNPTRRLYSSIRILKRMNYQAHWEAHIENPRIMLGHCPYRAILDHYPEICQMDAFMLQELLDTPVKQVEKLIFNTKGLAECVFLLNRPANSSINYSKFTK
jgi:predicted ArsR family transcriptional regulator